jgi:hypothetical protein
MKSPHEFFTWVAECCKLLNWKPEDGSKLLPENDPCWFYCFDDGMSPKDAVDEAIAKGVVVKGEK